MPSPYQIDNQQLANLLFTNRLATKEQIIELWPFIAPGKDIGSLLVEKGILGSSIYQKALEHILKPSPEAPPESTGARTPDPAEAPAPTTESGITGNHSLDQMLAFARSIDASDLHLSPGLPLMARRYGALVPLMRDALPAQRVQNLISELLTNDQRKQLESAGDLEFVYANPTSGRYRVTLMKQRAGWDLAARCIPSHIRSFTEAGLPESCAGLTHWAQGMVLVTGPGSCGKSSTLATLIEMINQTRTDHIITLESPIEFVFSSARCHITQREIGMHTRSQESALRAALREDPDVIVVGELRDLSTVRLAVSAAETGHLVLGTMNTLCASRTIYRLIDSFPTEEQAAMRNMVSESLRGVISQQLIPRLDGQGMVAAYEVLVVNSAVANMIRKDEMHQLGTAMITGKSSGMLLLDDSLRRLVAQGAISPQEAAVRGFSNRTAATKG